MRHQIRMVHLLALMIFASSLLTATPLTAGAQESATGSLVVTNLDHRGDPQFSVCFAVYADGGGVPVGGFILHGFCSGFDGLTLPQDLPSGSYILVQVNAAPGYRIANDIPFTIGAGETTTITVDNKRGAPHGTFTIRVFDGTGDPLGGACFAVFRDDNGVPGPFIVDQCDTDGNGHVLTRNQHPDDYILVQTAAPDGHQLAAPVPFRVLPNNDTALHVTV